MDAKHRVHRNIHVMDQALAANADGEEEDEAEKCTEGRRRIGKETNLEVI